MPELCHGIFNACMSLKFRTLKLNIERLLLKRKYCDTWVYTVGRSICLFCTHYCTVKSNCPILGQLRQLFEMSQLQVSSFTVHATPKSEIDRMFFVGFFSNDFAIVMFAFSCKKR